jgi:hypothetical protein
MDGSFSNFKKKISCEFLILFLIWYDDPLSIFFLWIIGIWDITINILFFFFSLTWVSGPACAHLD